MGELSRARLFNAYENAAHDVRRFRGVNSQSHRISARARHFLQACDALFGGGVGGKHF